MKRFTKVCLVLGILLLIAGAALGGVSYGLGVEKDIRSAMNPPAPEMEEITIPGAELGRLEIGLISDDVTVEASKDGDAHIRYPVSEEYRYALQTEEGKIRGLDRCVFQAEALERQGAFRFQVSLFWQDGPDVTVALPAGYAGELQIRTVSGDVAVRGITAGKSAVDTDSGDLLLSDAVISGKIDISSTSGDVTLRNLQMGSDCTVKTTSGDIRTSGGAFTRYHVSTTSGDVRTEEVGSTEWMHLQTISGDVTVRSSTITELECKTISGDIAVRDDDRIGSYQCSTTSGEVTTDGSVDPSLDD